jgi:predicted phosphodiesterase
MDGVVCGHIHKTEMRSIGGVLYCNSGDWVESCTALVERTDGSLALFSYADRVNGHEQSSAPGSVRAPSTRDRAP